MLKFSKKFNAVLVIVSLIVGLSGAYAWPFSEAALADAVSYSGQATVLRASVLGLSTTLGDTGAIVSEGDALEASILEATVPGLLTAQALHATAVGVANQTAAEAANANLNLIVGGVSVKADFLMASAKASCSAGSSVTSGSSQIASLIINGIPVVANGTENQTIRLLNGKVVLNEQTVNNGEIRVTALHIIVNNIADIVVSQAAAGIICSIPQIGNNQLPTVFAKSNPKDEFVTGGGWINGTPTGDKGNFGVGGGVKNGEFWGHLTYIDHGIKLKAKGTRVTGYCGIDDTTRQITGTAEINGVEGFTYLVIVSDNGEAGRNDNFSIILSNGYAAEGIPIQGGNIQLHNPQEIPPCAPLPPECEPPFIPNPNPPPDCIFDPGDV